MMKQEYNQNTISETIHTKWAGKTVHFAKETDSTNIWGKQLAKDGAPHGTIVVTEYQSKGKGRFDRKWMAAPGSSVMFTIIVKPEIPPVCAPMLTLVIGLSIAQAVEKLGVSSSIKWPNDVVVSGKKICGTLTEMGLDGNKIRYVLIGSGINVNTEKVPEELQEKATSLYIETGKTFDRNEILALVMECFEQNYEKFIRTCDLSLLLEEYNFYLANKNRQVKVLDPAGEYEGIARGINKDGELLVETEKGEMVQVSAGEVSVRGLYSYV